MATREQLAATRKGAGEAVSVIGKSIAPILHLYREVNEVCREHIWMAPQLASGDGADLAQRTVAGRTSMQVAENNAHAKGLLRALKSSAAVEASIRQSQQEETDLSARVKPRQPPKGHAL